VRATPGRADGAVSRADQLAEAFGACGIRDGGGTWRERERDAEEERALEAEHTLASALSLSLFPCICPCLCRVVDSDDDLAKMK